MRTDMMPSFDDSVDPEGYGPADDFDPAYEAYLDEILAVEEGRAIRLTGCAQCYHELTGNWDMTSTAAVSPLRGILDDTGVTYGFNREASARQGYDGDPYTVLTLSCGHKSI